MCRFNSEEMGAHWRALSVKVPWSDLFNRSNLSSLLKTDGRKHHQMLGSQLASCEDDDDNLGQCDSRVWDRRMWSDMVEFGVFGSRAYRIFLMAYACAVSKIKRFSDIKYFDLQLERWDFYY